MPKGGTWFSNRIKKMGLDIDYNYVVKINKSNSDKIEDDIKLNDDYNLMLLDQMYDYYEIKGGFKEYDKKQVLTLVRIIDLENSTNKWRMKGKYRQTVLNIVDYIIDVNYNFWGRLKNPNIDLKLVDDLSEAAYAKKTNHEGVDDKSLSSKVCKYFAKLIVDDKYFINDDIVRRVLPYYLKYYNVSTDIDNYKNKRGRINISKISYIKLYEYLTNLKNKADTNNELSKTEFDHILWYCYRQERI